MAEFRTVECTLDEHSDAILEIFNDAIVNSAALFEYEPRTPEKMAAWFKVKHAGNFPVIGLVDENNVLAGFASMGSFRPFPANKYTVEHSVYVHQDFRGQGLGRRLLELIIEAVKERELHAMIGGITADNHASIELHKKLGFVHVGTLPEVGFKFGHWQDLAFYQLTFETPSHPIDG